MAQLIHIISSLLIIGGALALLVGMLGIYRMPDFFTRLHAASIIDTLASMAIIFGLILHSGFNIIVIAKLVLILIFILVTTPTASHALAKSALHGKLKPMLKSESK